MSIKWNNRPAFIEMAAQALQAGDGWEFIMERLPEYAEPYSPIRRPGLPNPGRNQKRLMMVHIEQRSKEIARGIPLDRSEYRFMRQGWPGNQKRGSRSNE